MSRARVPVRRRCRPLPGGRRAAPLLCCLLLGAAGGASAQSWVNPGNGSWYEALNWSPAFVPAAGGAVVVSNGGTALLDTVASGGATATPQLSSLTVGLAGTGSGSGGVSSDGVDLRAGFLTVGVASGGAGSFADGRVVTTAAGLGVTGARIGSLFSQAVATAANGAVVVDGLYQAGGNLLEIAQMFGAAAGSVAQGRLVADSVSGTVGGAFWIVGNVTASDASQVGSLAQGEFSAASGTLVLASGSTSFIGTTLGPDRVSDVSGTRINEATGLVQLGGTLQVQQNGQSLLVGRTDGGRAEGTLDVGTLAMGASRFGELQVGTSGVLGQARGRLAAGGGDLQHNAGLYVGTTTGGQSQGEVQLGGALRGNGTGTANVGQASGGGGQLVQAQGSVVAAGGFAGYSGINVGTLVGDVAAGSQAVGRLVGGADAGAATTGTVLVGRIGNNGNGAALADGELRSAGSLGMNGGTLEVAQMFVSAAGSSARGVVELGGEVGTVGGAFLIVANISTNNASQVGSQSFGEVVAGGGMTLASASTTFIGTTLGPDRVSDVSGTRINESTGLVQLGGTLQVQQNGQALLVGRTDGGRADGTLEAGTLAMGASRFGELQVGTSGVLGQARGRLAAGGGDLQHNAGLYVGTTTGGQSQGEVQLGGALRGNGTGTANVGQASGGAGQLVQAQGTVVATGGFAGYNGINVGTLVGDVAAGSQAVGRLVGGADAGAATTGNVLVGRIGNNGNGAALADGELRSAGSLGMNGGTLEVAQMFVSAAGSSARGVVELGGEVGTVGGAFLIVANISTNNASQVGSQSFGEVVAGGGMTLASASTTFIGTTLGPDRVSDASGTRINEATGLVQLGGTLQVQQNGQALLVGRTDGGRADGTLEAGTLAMGASRFGELQVGTSGVLGQARGRLAAGGGDLQHNAGLYVGTTTGGQSQGEVQLGGALRGNGTGTANVGQASGGAGQLVQAQGTVVATGGFAGYSGINVGTLVGDVAAGSHAVGRMTGGADAGAVTTGTVLVGRIGSNGSGAALADGELRSAGALGMNGTGALELAQMIDSGAGSTVRGTVALGGDVGTAGGAFLIVGNITAFGAHQVGSQSFGELVAGGGMTLASASATFIGTTLGPDRVSDASGTRVNESTGLVRLGGTLQVQQNGQGMLVGRTGGGRATGALELARIESGANAFGLFEVGTAIDGEATGRLTVGGGTLRTSSLWVGRVFGSGSASGEAALSGTTLEAGSVVAGTGGGSADIALADSAAAIADDFVLGRGRLALERSLLAIGDEFSLGADATLALMIENEDRGTGYGAVDAVTALLDGELQLDLTSYVFGSGSGVFDLVRAGVAGSIAGDFVSVVFSGLAAGWQAITGVELVNGQEIYRLRLSTVPEPGSVALVLLALGLLMLAARRRQAAAFAPRR